MDHLLHKNTLRRKAWGRFEIPGVRKAAGGGLVKP